MSEMDKVTDHTEHTAIEFLLQKMEKMEEQLREIKERKIEYHITIHDIHVNDPILKELSFNLEALDIKELSGSLNLGNNFSPKVEQKGKMDLQKEPRKKKQKQSSEQNQSSNGIIILINGKRIPYSIQ
ncbi:hypothetical protein ACFSCX_14015 [Bacillus salitolerans]|uniref:Uncharacterized protein n=1 Tax=Bacillus salitolerans TaxID=1437434 RepID=A0ABW4LRH3_9BACI